MRRNSSGAPIMMVHRWSRPALSCQPCREKKRRCDRTQPCSNCALRDIPCEYAGRSQSDEPPDGRGAPPTNTSDADPAAPARPSGPKHVRSKLDSLSPEEVLNRLQKLEEVVFDRSSQSSPATRDLGAERSAANTVERSPSADFVPFALHLHSDSYDEPRLDTASLTRRLPPVGQARDLFHQYATIIQPTIQILHMPSTRDLVEQAYQRILEGQDLDATTLLLLFSIFAGSALAWTPELLEKLGATQTEAKIALLTYTRLAMSVLDDHESVPPSTIALAALGTLSHVVTSCEGYRYKLYTIRTRCITMSRMMQVHRLDTAKAREERNLKGCNMIEVEVQRRVWWNMVASDWLSSFAGHYQDGVYMFHPAHMKVDFPSNIDDDFITPTKVLHDFPLSTPTSMSSFIFRLKLAAICREVADVLGPYILESQEPDYEVILKLDEKFQGYLKEMPTYMRLDPTSARKSLDVCRERPNIAWQRIGMNFSLHSRLCRLHRPYHLEGTTNPKYAYSHSMCIRSAQTVLELRRTMEDASAPVGLRPARSWTVMQHVFLAALILATDVSFNPNAPSAEARKAKVLAAYQTLERSKAESSALMEGVQRNMQTVLATLHSNQAQAPSSDPKGAAGLEYDAFAATGEATLSGLDTRGFGYGSVSDGEDRSGILVSPTTGNPISIGDGTQESFWTGGVGSGEVGWDQVWSEFLDVAPGLDVSQWSSLLDGMDFSYDSSLPEG